MVSYRYREWTNAWKRFREWRQAVGDPESIAYEIVARSFPEKHTSFFPDTTIWEIQLSSQGPIAWRPHLCVVLTTYPIAIRVVRHDAPRREPLDAIAETKLAGMVTHHRDMLSGGWSHLGGGAYCFPPDRSLARESVPAHPP